jgi:hypothetical protein
MGIAAEGWGIEISFYVVGVTLLIGTAALALVAHHASSIEESTRVRVRG